MSDIECPYCKYEQEINHDDGYGYEEDRLHEQDCLNCRKTFRFETSISFTYSPYCQDGDCEWEAPFSIAPNFYTCKNCENSKIERGDV